MLERNRSILAAILILLTTAAVALAPAAPQTTAGQQGMTPEQQAQAETERLTGLLVAPARNTWILSSEGGLAMLTFDPSGKFENISLVKPNSLMPTGAQTSCTGVWTLSGTRLIISERVCISGLTRGEPMPDMGAEILKLDDTTLVIKVDDGGTFEFTAKG